MEATQNAEVIELSLEKTIETKLVQANVTQQVLAALKQKYAGMKLAAIDDKESYLEIKAAAKECAKVRTLTVKLCKEGRERAVKEQKLWIAKEKEVVGEIAEVEDALDAEIKRFDDEVARIEQEEKNRQEEAYINRQAALTKMGATYVDGSFTLGEASFEANLIKGSSESVWNEAVLPKFQEEYEKIEAVRIAAEQKKAEQEAVMRAEQEKLRAEQEKFRLEQEEFARKQAEANRIEQEKLAAEQREKERIEREAEFERMKIAAAEAAEAKRLADVEKAKQDAILAEKKRQADAEEAKRQEEIRKQMELEAANDKTKWEDFINQVKEINTFDMRSGQYRKKMQIAKEKLDEILSL
jgi:fused signal recognition particle receptor